MSVPKSPTAVVVIAVRAERGWSQGDLAEALDEADPNDTWTRVRVRNLESGKLTVTGEILRTLSAVLDVDYRTLIDGWRRT